jgi:hypothetical protein
MAGAREIQIPPLLDPSRHRAFALLIAVAVGEVVAQVAATGALKALLVGATGGEQAVILLVTTGLAAAAFNWGRDVMGERLGLDYSNHVRRALGRQALAVASRGGPGRFGTIAIRMTGDLSALKDWARGGVCGGIAGTLGLIGAVIAAWWTAGLAGLTATMVGPVLAILVGCLLVARLHGEVCERRKHKGRLSARIGDMLLGASASAAYASERRAIGMMDRAARDALEAQTRQVAAASLMKLPALLTLPLGAAMAVVLQGFGLSPTGGVAGWAALLFALSLASLACSQLMNALIHFIERRIAMAKLKELAALGNQMPTAVPQGEVRLRTGKGLQLTWKGEVLVEAGGHRMFSRRQTADWLDSVLYAGEGVALDGQDASKVRDIDWARRVAYSGPLRGLVRGPLDLVLAARRRAPEADMRSALELAGLPVSWLSENPIIDPQSPTIGEQTLARLRLARALAHGPRVLIVDDPWLAEDNSLMNRIRSWCRHRNVSLIEIVGNSG